MSTTRNSRALWEAYLSDIPRHVSLVYAHGSTCDARTSRSSSTVPDGMFVVLMTTPGDIVLHPMPMVMFKSEEGVRAALSRKPYYYDEGLRIRIPLYSVVYPPGSVLPPMKLQFTSSRRDGACAKSDIQDWGRRDRPFGVWRLPLPVWLGWPEQDSFWPYWLDKPGFENYQAALLSACRDYPGYECRRDPDVVGLSDFLRGRSRGIYIINACRVVCENDGSGCPRQVETPVRACSAMANAAADEQMNRITGVSRPASDWTCMIQKRLQQIDPGHIMGRRVPNVLRNDYHRPMATDVVALDSQRAAEALLGTNGVDDSRQKVRQRLERYGPISCPNLEEFLCRRPDPITHR